MAANISIAGRCEPRYSAVRLAFEENMYNQTEGGAAVAVYHHQKSVVDLWGGYADKEQNSLWQPDTIVNVWSVTKAIVALCALRLDDSGELILSSFLGPLYN